MNIQRLCAERLLEHPLGRGLVAIPITLIVVITIVDIHMPVDIHLGPLLVVAPALTVSFAGPRLTSLIGALAVSAEILIAGLHGGLNTTNHIAQIIALTILSTVVTLVCLVREQRGQELSRVRSVAETAQRVLLRPPPRRVGPLCVAWLYLAAEDEAQIGGDLFGVARIAHGSRAIIGDVRGKGLDAIGEASVVLGAFREGAHRCATLPALVTALEESVSRSIEEVAEIEHDHGEHFITALTLDIPDHDSRAEMVNCGHPPPLLLHGHDVQVLHSHSPAPPLGVCEPFETTHRTDAFTFEAGDALLLYTDGVVEARSPAGVFYPLAERLASFPMCGPEALLRHIHEDLLAHTGKHLADDAALLVIERAPSRLHLHGPHIPVHHQKENQRVNGSGL
ncbi:PP2C family protein-serine/threonine phosphatase [Streptomyces sp. AK02-01A]|uniref:PP2C family protein-serine/threonine phosphatase n=1 Tax=Streptomyces sp. AK02-01A TaxID=3028648 RepID=UPI0029A17720|nr:PP2C family protein-serine/threonine phosphatase [Streptomyces sp. AK02-01A]MDX3853694.1 PP2C family protein-serine/threonine phosphatase [Streptomyces sp. AK02-01A]